MSDTATIDRRPAGTTLQNNRPMMFEEAAALADAVLSRIGNDIRMGLPIGCGKPTIVANEIYRRAKQNPNIKLKIFSGLSLHKPIGKSELEKRFIGPLAQRLFPDYPDPEFTLDSHAGKLPDNVELSDFYITPGAFVGNKYVQQGYISSNYSHVPRDVLDAGVNVAASMICRGQVGGREMYSLSSNADAPLDTAWEMIKQREQGKKVAIIGQVNQNLPFMFGTAVNEPETFDFILDNPSMYHGLFGPPREAVVTQDYFIGINASTLIKDGGSIQIGIGSLGDALTYGLKARNCDNAEYRELMSATGIYDKFSSTIDKIGGLEPFEQGLYGITELMIDGFIQLMNCGVLKRNVYDNLAIQTLINEGRITDEVTPRTLEALAEAGAVNSLLNENDLALLKEFGIFGEHVTMRDGMLYNGGAAGILPDINSGASMDAMAAHCLGDRLKNEVLVHASFFIGPQSFYDALNNMSDLERRRIQMREISFCNQVYGEQRLKIAQRQHARFVNVALMQTLLGSTVSDGLEDGQVISGVGGQYNFVSMAHALPGGRSIILLRSTKQRGRELLSNIRWNYGHCTIPRHLRDIVITEYGIAELRGIPDRKVIAEILNITDSRFQKSLLAKAIEKGKIPKDYKIPLAFRNNYPERLDKELAPFRKKGLFPPFPFGTQLTDEEIVLGKSLQKLKSVMETKQFKLPSPGQIGKILSPPAAAKPYLQRMALDNPASRKEVVLQKLVLYALTLSGSV